MILGVVLAAETGFLIEKNPDLVGLGRELRAKASSAEHEWKKFFPGVPDLAVEVISPDDTRREISEKVNMWLAHETVSCWVADPDSMTVTIHRNGRDAIQLKAGDEIANEPALPGFIFPVAPIFRRR